MLTFLASSCSKSTKKMWHGWMIYFSDQHVNLPIWDTQESLDTLLGQPIRTEHLATTASSYNLMTSTQTLQNLEPVNPETDQPSLLFSDPCFSAKPCESHYYFLSQHNIKAFESYPAYLYTPLSTLIILQLYFKYTSLIWECTIWTSWYKTGENERKNKPAARESEAKGRKIRLHHLKLKSLSNYLNTVLELELIANCSNCNVWVKLFGNILLPLCVSYVWRHTLHLFKVIST
jgi:hypothetical protein